MSKRMDSCPTSTIPLPNVSSHFSNKCDSKSISIYFSPSIFNVEKTARISSGDDTYESYATNHTAEFPSCSCNDSVEPSKSQNFCSVSMHEVREHANEIATVWPADQLNHVQPHSHSERQINLKSFDSFRTWPARSETHRLKVQNKPPEEETYGYCSSNHEIEVLPVARYFDALEGPELDTLKDTEESILPQDEKWPFLLRFPISSFGTCLGLSSQAILWKTLAVSPATAFLHVSLIVNLVLWSVSIATTAVISIIYALKVVFYFEAVRREYYHPIRTNFFFAPWIACLFLVLGLPPSLGNGFRPIFWYIFMTPIFCLELKVYGQWMSSGERRLSKVANPSNHLSIVGNFVGALLGASMGLKDGPMFFFAIGLAHYAVLFVTLYQRLPTNETIPRELHPVFFLFVAAPSVASVAWARIQEDFDYVSRIAYFMAMFLYISLAIRINFFRGFRFSLAWWAYTFPMTGASVATIKYSSEVDHVLIQTLSVVLSFISSFTVSALFISTIIHAFVRRDLFPNDIAIAISRKRKKTSKKCWSMEPPRPAITVKESYVPNIFRIICRNVLETIVRSCTSMLKRLSFWHCFRKSN